MRKFIWLVSTRSFLILSRSPRALHFVKKTLRLTGLLRVVVAIVSMGTRVHETQPVYSDENEFWRKQKSRQIENDTHHTIKPSRTLYIVGPIPPDKSGVAEYAYNLALHLKNTYDITFVVEKKSKKYLNLDFKVIDGEEFKATWAKGESVIYQIGNSPFHAFEEDLLIQIPGIVDLHDVSLRDLILFSENGNVQSPDLVQRVIHEIGWSHLSGLPKSKEDLPDLNSRFIKLGLHTVVHNDEAKNRIIRQNFQMNDSDISVIPLGKSPVQKIDKEWAREILGLSKDEIIISTFGFLGAEKYSAEIIEQLEIFATSQNSGTSLYFVGQRPEGQLREDVEAKISKSKNLKVKFTGWISDTQYQQFLAASDACVQLRKELGGESSAALIDCLFAERPLVISDIPANRSIPQNAVYRAEIEELNKSLKSLFANPTESEEKARIGKKFAEDTYTMSSVSNKYSTLIQNMENVNPLYVKYDLASTHRTIYVDVSAIMNFDLETGIQRVVKKITKEWLASSKEMNLEITPVFYDEIAQEFKTAEAFRARLLQWNKNLYSPGSLAPRNGDVFVGLDLSFNNLQKTALQELQKKGVKVFFVVYDLLPITHPEYFPKEAVEKFTDWAEMTSHFDGIFAISQATISSYRNHFQSLDESFKLGNFVMGSDFGDRPKNINGIRRDRTRKATTNFLMVGTIEPRKGHLEIIRGFEELWELGFDVRLTVIGKWGWLSKRAKGEIQSSIDRNAYLNVFTDVDDNQLAKAYLDSDCLIMASHAEGFGLPIVEAASIGLPILARDIDVFKEVAGEGADYFQNNTPVSLQIIGWLEKFRENAEARSSQIKIYTWRDSAKSLLTAILGSL